MSKPFKMRGHELPGPNQRVSKSSPAKGFLQDFVKGKGAMGFLNPAGRIASWAGKQFGEGAEKFLNPASMLFGNNTTSSRSKTKRSTNNPNAVTPPVETDPLEMQEIEQEVSGMQDSEKNELITKLVSDKKRTE